jgi:Rieske Fe-S protein
VVSQGGSNRLAHAASGRFPIVDVIHLHTTYARQMVGDGCTGEPVTNTTAIPVGGGVVFAELGVVITQPKPGVFVGFDSTCPHRGCSVRAVAAGTINCFCHGSRFRIADGSVAGGPARQPLGRRSIVIREGRISLG